MFILFLCVWMSLNVANSNLIITGVIDGPLSNRPRALEIYVYDNIADLSSVCLTNIACGGNGCAIHVCVCLCLSVGLHSRCNVGPKQHGRGPFNPKRRRERLLRTLENKN